MIYETSLVFLFSYFSGSIPFGLILAKFFLNKDISKIGSKNIGATNVLRTGNKYIALLTLIMDILKGLSPVLVTKNYFPDLIYLSALAAFLGHIFPVWLSFKGGKGVATYLGVIFALSFKFAIIFCVCWILIAFITKYSSLSSIVSTLLIFLISLMNKDFEINSFFFITFVIILYTHRQNILRIKNGEEDKIKL